MALLIREADVARWLPMPECVAAVEAAFEHLDTGQAQNIPRARTRLPAGQMHVMAAADSALGYVGLKAYTAFKGQTRFVVLLFSAESGELLALVEADTLGQRRTGAASGVATKHMARADAATVGVYGSGWQARSQLSAVAVARPLRQVRVFSRNPERRQSFADEMSRELGVEVTPVERPEQAAEGADILVTITSAREPVLKGEWLTPGVHINAAGSNALIRRELDDAAVLRCDRIVADALDQARIEAGDLLPLTERGALHWGQVRSLGEVVTGRFPGRAGDQEITLFKSLGLAVEDIAAAAVVYERAKAEGGVEDVRLFE